MSPIPGDAHSVLTNHLGLEREPWIAEVEAEYQRRFAHNTCKAVGLRAVPIENELAIDVCETRMFGAPLAHENPPACCYCEGEMFVLLQLRADHLSLLWHPEGKPMLCVFACFEAGCCRQIEEDCEEDSEGDCEEGYSKSRFAVRYTALPENLRPLYIHNRWPALKLEMTWFDDTPEDDWSRERWWGLAWTEFFHERADVNEETDAVLLDWFNEATATPASNHLTEGFKIGGHPWAPRSGLDPRCDVVQDLERPCGQRMEHLLQLPPDCVVPAESVLKYVGSPLRVVTSFRRFGHVFVCRDCGEKSLKMIWSEPAPR